MVRSPSRFIGDICTCGKERIAHGNQCGPVELGCIWLTRLTVVCGVIGWVGLSPTKSQRFFSVCQNTHAFLHIQFDTVHVKFNEVCQSDNWAWRAMGVMRIPSLYPKFNGSFLARQKALSTEWLAGWQFPVLYDVCAQPPLFHSTTVVCGMSFACSVLTDGHQVWACII